MSLSDEDHYKLLKALEADPAVSQRELSAKLGLSLGKVNYCLQSLINRGIIKARRFKNGSNKRGYLYALTPAGQDEKIAVTARFLRHKTAEYGQLQEEIEQLRQEIQSFRSISTSEAVRHDSNRSALQETNSD